MVISEKKSEKQVKGQQNAVTKHTWTRRFIIRAVEINTYRHTY